MFLAQRLPSPGSMLVILGELLQGDEIVPLGSVLCPLKMLRKHSWLLLTLQCVEYLWKPCAGPNYLEIVTFLADFYADAAMFLPLLISHSDMLSHLQDSIPETALPIVPVIVLP